MKKDNDSSSPKEIIKFVLISLGMLAFAIAISSAEIWADMILGVY